MQEIHVLMNCIGICGYTFTPAFTFRPLTHQYSLLTLIFLPGVSVCFTFVSVLITMNVFFKPLRISLICPPLLPLIYSIFLRSLENSKFCIFPNLKSHISLSVSVSLFICNQRFSFLFSLGHCECCFSAYLWGWGMWVRFPRSVGFSNPLGVEPPHDIICLILCFQGPLAVMLIKAPTSYPQPLAYKGPLYKHCSAISRLYSFG